MGWRWEGATGVALLAVLMVALVGCISAPVPVPVVEWVPFDSWEAAREVSRRALVVALVAADDAFELESRECREVAFGVTACPTANKLEEWGWIHHLREPSEALLVAPLDPPDPVEIRDGLAVYDLLLGGVARRVRTHMDLWENTPTLSAEQVQYFEEHPEVWERVVSFRGAAPGRQRLARFREVWSETQDRQARRNLVLRNGVFYFEDPVTAARAVNQIQFRDLFDEPRITLYRAGRRYVLQRGANQHYYFTEPAFRGYRARLVLLDRVGVEGSLDEPISYDLQNFRRQNGVDRIEVGQETGAGRAGEVVFLDGSRYQARLVRAARGVPAIGILVDPEELGEVLRQSRFHGNIIYGLMDVAEKMVRENLFFDEPENEIGQQDGIMRRFFMRAYANGLPAYVVNGVSYQVFDSQGRPRPPQVCIDYITDVVERYAGAWWPDRNVGARRPTEGRISFRDYMTYRQVRLLVRFAEERPWAASLYSFTGGSRVPWSEQQRFFQNLWQRREDLRIGDVIIIYGLRPTGRNHYHSFFIHETDPIHGVPLTITDQAGTARIRSWTDVMRTAPRRQIYHRLRFNPYWIHDPQAVEVAVGVGERARVVVVKQAARRSR